MKLVSAATVERIAREQGINTKVGGIKYWQYATSVELEHTHDIRIAFKIATDHISEFFNYYEELFKMEEKLKKMWKGKQKPNLYFA